MMVMSIHSGLTWDMGVTNASNEVIIRRGEKFSIKRSSELRRVAGKPCQQRLGSGQASGTRHRIMCSAPNGEQL